MGDAVDMSSWRDDPDVLQRGPFVWFAFSPGLNEDGSFGPLGDDGVDPDRILVRKSTFARFLEVSIRESGSAALRIGPRETRLAESIFIQMLTDGVELFEPDAMLAESGILWEDAVRRLCLRMGDGKSRLSVTLLGELLCEVAP